MRTVGKCSEQGDGNVGTGLGIGQCVVVIAQVKSAIGGNGVEFVVGQLLEQPFRGLACAVKPVVGVIHLVTAKNRLQATLVKGLVVRYQGDI